MIVNVYECEDDFQIRLDPETIEDVNKLLRLSLYRTKKLNYLYYKPYRNKDNGSCWVCIGKKKNTDETIGD